MNAFEQDGALARIRVAPVATTYARQDAQHVPLLLVRSTARPGLAQRVTALLEHASTWRERSRQRRRLAELDDHLLRDLGLTRADVDLECRKPFWRP